jgi:hypothetical protein
MFGPEPTATATLMLLPSRPTFGWCPLRAEQRMAIEVKKGVDDPLAAQIFALPPRLECRDGDTDREIQAAGVRVNGNS